MTTQPPITPPITPDHEPLKLQCTHRSRPITHRSRPPPPTTDHAHPPPLEGGVHDRAGVTDHQHHPQTTARQASGLTGVSQQSAEGCAQSRPCLSPSSQTDTTTGTSKIATMPREIPIAAGSEGPPLRRAIAPHTVAAIPKKNAGKSRKNGGKSTHRMAPTPHPKATLESVRARLFSMPASHRANRATRAELSHKAHYPARPFGVGQYSSPAGRRTKRSATRRGPTTSTPSST